jgi:hypothetical protein
MRLNIFHLRFNNFTSNEYKCEFPLWPEVSRRWDVQKPQDNNFAERREQRQAKKREQL